MKKKAEKRIIFFEAFILSQQILQRHLNAADDVHGFSMQFSK